MPRRYGLASAPRPIGPLMDISTTPYKLPTPLPNFGPLSSPAPSGSLVGGSGSGSGSGTGSGDGSGSGAGSGAGSGSVDIEVVLNEVMPGVVEDWGSVVLPGPSGQGPGVYDNIPGGAPTGGGGGGSGPTGPTGINPLEQPALDKTYADIIGSGSPVNVPIGAIPSGGVGGWVEYLHGLGGGVLEGWLDNLSPDDLASKSEQIMEVLRDMGYNPEDIPAATEAQVAQYMGGTTGPGSAPISGNIGAGGGMPWGGYGSPFGGTVTVGPSTGGRRVVLPN